MDQSQITYEFFSEGGDFDVKAWLGGVPIGYARCVSDGESLLLADIRVEKEVARRWPILPNLLRLLIGERQPWRLRGLGIGSRLLGRVLQEADAAGFREIRGSVMAADIQAWPGLLNWYRRYGFGVTEPDERCVPGAAKKIVRRKQ
jgi:GNAT superfamily N-acetyltransferase